MKLNVRDPSCAQIAMVPTLHRLKIARSGRRRRRFNVSALTNTYPFRKPDSWLKPRCRLWSLEVRPTPLPLPPLPLQLPPEESKSVQCQTSLTWVFSKRPQRTTESNVRSSGGPGSVSTGTRASSGKSRTVSADARVPCESAKCYSETDKGSADPPKLPLGVPPIPTKWHLRVLRFPSKAHLRVQHVP